MCDAQRFVLVPKRRCLGNIVRMFAWEKARRATNSQATLSSRRCIGCRSGTAAAGPNTGCRSGTAAVRPLHAEHRTPHAASHRGPNAGTPFRNRRARPHHGPGGAAPVTTHRSGSANTASRVGNRRGRRVCHPGGAAVAPRTDRLVLFRTKPRTRLALAIEGNPASQIANYT